MNRISIIVCSYNRAGSLSKTLESIAQTIAASPGIAVEAVIVDNASTDTTDTVIQAWKDSVTFPVLAVYEPRQGVSAARNAGLRAATGDIISFTDDDCRLAPDFFRTLLAHYVADTAPVMRGGRVELGTTDDIPFSIKIDPQGLRMEDASFPGGFIMGANMSFRAIMEHVGWFDERFGCGAAFRSAEDTDYIYRVQTAGFRVEYVTDIVVHHFHGRRDMPTIRRLNYGYMVGNGALYAKYLRRPHLLRHFYWDCRKLLREWCGGPMMYDEFDLSFGMVVRGNLHGMALYAMHRLRQCFGGARKHA